MHAVSPVSWSWTPLCCSAGPAPQTPRVPARAHVEHVSTIRRKIRRAQTETGITVPHLARHDLVTKKDAAKQFNKGRRQANRVVAGVGLTDVQKRRTLQHVAARTTKRNINVNHALNQGRVSTLELGEDGLPVLKTPRRVAQDAEGFEFHGAASQEYRTFVKAKEAIKADPVMKCVIPRVVLWDGEGTGHSSDSRASQSRRRAPSPKIHALSPMLPPTRTWLAAFGH